MARASHRRTTVPEWLRHPLRVASGPVPYGTVLRGALTTGPLLAAGVAAHHVAWGVLAALGAMFATVNDRPGTRRTRVVRIGAPAAAGALGTVLGTLLTMYLPPADGLPDGLWAVPVLALAGWLSGAVSVVGPVGSAAGLQFLVTLLIAAGSPPHGPVWLAPLLVIAGALWHLLVVLATRPRPHHEERRAVAAVYERIGAVLAAAGTGSGQAERRALSAALDHAHAVLEHHRGPRRLRRVSPAERGLRARLTAAGAAAEASVSLLHEGTPLPEAVLDAPLHLAHAVRTGGPSAPLVPPAPRTPGQRALRDALGHAAEVARTDRHTGPELEPVPVRLRDHPGTRRALGPLGRSYGLRVALCVGACTAVAVVLHPAQWHWLPVTAAFVAKPDLGPLFSRVVSRVAGTVLAITGYLALDALLPSTAAALTAAALGGALIPVAARHFAYLTAALTAIVLALAGVGGTVGAPGARLTDTLLGCLIALGVGHLPRIGGRRSAVHEHWAAALRAAEAYFAHVVGVPPGDRAELDRLRRAAYRSLAEAHTALAQAASELPPAGVPATRWAPLLTALERLVDATTACAVRLRDGRPLPADESRRLADALARLAADASARRPTDWPPLPAPAELRPRCTSLAEVAHELHAVRRFTQAA
ncbi:FUSC family protein [Streptomyces minutiscleroticus]|uniref:FUSC family protein n=1 Tax=Streptomyces minutiscleroticus TaxID=68238 RepID=A0A918U471_9ACTN|nr:FUSC family protein [Streptomyces minutiscleroticus]GGX88438.1 FUSC family protein [Streptomyces minutiscleroticus]